MRKISLKLESLAVESFVTSPVIVSAGTVQAHEDEAAGAATLRLCTQGCTLYSCPVQNTEYASCQIYCDCTVKGSPC